MAIFFFKVLRTNFNFCTNPPGILLGERILAMSKSAVATNTTAGARDEAEEDNPITAVHEFISRIHAPRPTHEFHYNEVMKNFVCSVKMALDDGTVFEHKSAKHSSKKDAKREAFKALFETLKKAQAAGTLRPNVRKVVTEKAQRIRSDAIWQFGKYVKRIFLGRVRPKFVFTMTETGFRCTVSIPMGDTMTELTGNDRRKKTLAKRSACEMALEHLRELFPHANRQRYYRHENRHGWMSGQPHKRPRSYDYGSSGTGTSRSNGLLGHEVPSGQHQTDATVTTWNSPAVSCESGNVTMLIDQFLYLGSNETAEKLKTLKNLNVQFVLKLVNKALETQQKALNVTVQTSKDVTSHVLGVRDADAMTSAMLSVFKEAAKSLQDAWESDQGVLIAHGSNRDSAAFVAVLWLIMYQKFTPSTAWNFVCLRNNEHIGSEETLTGATLDEDGGSIGAKLSWFQAAKACASIATDK